jgi:hypothetical protein
LFGSAGGASSFRLSSQPELEGQNLDSASILYDSTARPSTSTSPYGAQTTFNYFDTAVPPYKQATTNGHWAKTIMDGFGRTIEAQTGNGTTVVSYVDTNYGPCGCSPLGKVNATSMPYAVLANRVWINSYTEGNLELRDISGYVPPPPNMPNMNLSTYLGSAAAATIPDASGQASNNVVVGGIFFNATAFQQKITLVHEALHTGTGEVDSELANDFHLGDNLPESAASAAITAWLANGCAPVH